MESIIDQLYKSGLKFLIPQTTAETYSTLIEEARELVGAKYGSIFLWHKDALKRVYTNIPDEAQIIPRARGFAYKAFRQGEIVIVNKKNLVKSHPEIKDSEVKKLILVPLSYNGSSIGVSVLHWAGKEKFSKTNLKMLRLFGALASLSIKKTQLYQETKEALRTRDLFIGLVSHELGTPLTVISIYTELLAKTVGLTQSMEAKWATELSLEMKRFTDLMHQLLDVNMISSGKILFSMKECNLKNILQKSLEQFKLMYPNHDVKIVDNIGKKSDEISGDTDKLLLALGNILNNAGKFSPSGSVIEIKLDYKIPYFLIAVKDSGIGIAKKDLPKIFDGFYKGTSSYEKGLGLGLFLTKNIVEHHHGKVDVVSQKDSGTTIQISLPAQGV